MTSISNIPLLTFRTSFDELLKSNLHSQRANVRSYDVDILLGEELLEQIDDLHGKLATNGQSQPEIQQ